jgi:3-deoxy-manno-octulosonate cytidylyltransferase (CMP-KDO synthetase)
VELHGKNPQQIVIAIIPARYESTRLPGKMLREIAGKPLILHTLGQVKKARTVDRVIVATDDERILDVVKNAGGCKAVMTRSDHASGTDRLAEVAETLTNKAIIVNVQGDEPLISPETIDKAVGQIVYDKTIDIATASEPIEDFDDLMNFNIVKVVMNGSADALYFSRSPMPFPREAALRYGGDPNKAIINEPKLLTYFRKHVGLYVYRCYYLRKLAKMPQSRLEKIEMLEQLRALENGARIKVVRAVGKSIGVDTEEDLELVRQMLEERGQAALPDLS